MILEYLSDNADAEGTVLGDLACACERRGRTLMDVVQNMGRRPQHNEDRAVLGGYSPMRSMSEEGTLPMDSRHVFAPLVQPVAPKCRTCGKGHGDVNVNVNVATGTKSSAGSEAAGERSVMPMPTFEGGIRQERTHENGARGASSAVSSDDMRRIIAEELRRPAESTPSVATSTTSNVPSPRATVEYRPFAVPRDRVVVRREERPFAVVWDRIKRIVQPRDINHPIDRVRLVPGRITRPMFEGSRPVSQGSLTQGGATPRGGIAPRGGTTPRGGAA